MNMCKMNPLGLCSPLNGHTYKIKFLIFLHRRSHENHSFSMYQSVFGGTTVSPHLQLPPPSNPSYMTCSSTILNLSAVLPALIHWTSSHKPWRKQLHSNATTQNSPEVEKGREDLTDKLKKENQTWYLHGLIKVSDNARSLTRSWVPEARVIGVADNPLDPGQRSCRGHGFVWKVACWHR